MKARVKITHFDDLGLHKVGDVVEVEQASRFVEIIAEETETKTKPAKADVEEAPAKTTKSNSKTKKKG